MKTHSRDIVWKPANQDEWDDLVANMGGHPLQTTVWGDCRKLVDGIDDLRLIAFRNEAVFGLARVELRAFRILGTIGWVPQGPVMGTLSNRAILEESLKSELKLLGLSLFATSPWQDGKEENLKRQTIQIDLTVGESQLLKGLDKKMRSGIRKARKMGLEIRQSKEDDEICHFFNLCEKIGQMKAFAVPGSKELLLKLINSPASRAVEVRLFIANSNGNLAGGVVVMRCGENIHYLWGGVDRDYSNFRPGDAVQWAVIEWGIAAGCKVYDLEGIDPIKNPGTYKFKKKMGGKIVRLARPHLFGISLLGRVATPILKKKLQ